MLIILAGLPGVGKTTIARELAGRLGAVHARIDSIEQSLRKAGVGALDDVGYVIAEDNLKLGHTVIADSVNPLALSRDAWRQVAERPGVMVLEVEIVCSDATGHRRRVEARITDIFGLRLPSWQDVVEREYHPWNRHRLVIDTSLMGVEENVEIIRAALVGLQKV